MNTLTNRNPSLITLSVVVKEQPLLLEELLEQEKREQEKQMQTQPTTNREEQQQQQQENDSTLLSDHDFEKLKADVFNSGQLGGLTQQAAPPTTSVVNQARANFINRLANTNVGSQWQQQANQQQRAAPAPSPQPQQQQAQIAADVTPRIPTFNTNLLPAPPLPPEHIVTEQDKQTQLVYEQWLKHQSVVLQQQLKFYETEVQKLRKMRKVGVEYEFLLFFLT